MHVLRADHSKFPEIPRTRPQEILHVFAVLVQHERCSILNCRTVAADCSIATLDFESPHPTLAGVISREGGRRGVARTNLAPTHEDIFQIIDTGRETINNTFSEFSYVLFVGNALVLVDVLDPSLGLVLLLHDAR